VASKWGLTRQNYKEMAELYEKVRVYIFMSSCAWCTWLACSAWLACLLPNHRPMFSALSCTVPIPGPWNSGIPVQQLRETRTR
jgi:hypothetical protein